MKYQFLLILSLCFYISNCASKWYTGAKATAYWDCSGMACDAQRVPGNKWNNGKNPFYTARQKYAFMTAKNPKYGEKYWGTFAASDKFDKLLGGNANNYKKCTDYKGCGKCIQIQVTNSNQVKNRGHTAVLMKTNRCPPWSNGCNNKYHVDMAVPGFDDLAYSTANTCGKSTCFTNKQASGQCVTNSHNPDLTCSCDIEDNTLKAGCQAFKKWGWKTGNPTIKFRVVNCPSQLVSYVQSAKVANTKLSCKGGSKYNGGGGGSSGKKYCYIKDCGCPNNFKKPNGWTCEKVTHRVQDNWCQQSSSNCSQCAGSWCSE